VVEQQLDKMEGGDMDSQEKQGQVHLDDRMKEYEKGYKILVDPQKPYIIRLDGHRFSKFVRPFKKPFDERIHNAMVRTAAELLSVFGATTAFTCSDEITLTFPAAVPAAGEEIVEKSNDPIAQKLVSQKSKKKLQTQESTEEDTGEKKKDKNADNPQAKVLFGGRVQKIVSYTAALASVSFLSHLKEEQYDPNTEKGLIDMIAKSHAYFDSRVFSVPNNGETLNNVLWRHKFDYRRNSISGLARHHYTPKELHGLHSGDQIAKMLEKGVDWHAQPAWYKWGTFIKKQLYSIETKNPKTEEPVTAIRTRIVRKSFALDDFSQDNIYFLFSKYYPETDKEVDNVTW